MMSEQRLMDWLLEPSQPAIRYHALLDLLDYSSRDSEVREALSGIPKLGWAHDILVSQKLGGYWDSRKDLYLPKYTATNWMALVLSDLGLTKENKQIRKTADLFLRRWMGEQELNIFHDEVCIVGNTARMLTRFGYEDDPKVRRLFDRLVEDQRENGGWHCWAANGTLDCWEALAAFAALPRSKWTKRIKNSVERGAEFYLERELFKQGRRYAPWLRFHYPIHYYYDLLVGLDIITSLGYAGDRRLKAATRILERKRRPDSTWVLDKIHPDLGAGAGYRLKKRPRQFSLEKEGRPSKWITLTALRILKRIDNAN